MIEITDNAASQILLSAQQSGLADALLRIAIKKLQDGSLHYALGFDEVVNDDDTAVDSNGIRLVLSEKTKPFADGMTIDFVEIEPGKNNFIFLNPNDPNYQPPSEA